MVKLKENNCMRKNFVQACAPEKKKRKKVQQTSRLLQNSCNENFFFPSGRSPCLRLFLEVRLLLRSGILSHNLRSFLVLWEIFEAAEIIEVQSDKGLDKFWITMNYDFCSWGPITPRFPTMMSKLTLILMSDRDSSLGPGSALGEKGQKNWRAKQAERSLGVFDSKVPLTFRAQRVVLCSVGFAFKIKLSIP